MINGFDMTRSERRGMIILTVIIAITALAGVYESTMARREWHTDRIEVAQPTPEAAARVAKEAQRDSVKKARREINRKKHSNAKPAVKKQPEYRDMLDDKTDGAH